MYPAYCAMPTMNTAEQAINAAEQLTHALLHLQPAAPFQVGPTDRQHLGKLAKIFQNTLLTNKQPVKQINDVPP